jgi:hypothetical protein
VPAIFEPVPVVAIPVTVVFVLVQLKVVPFTLFGFVIVILPIEVPEQIVCVLGVALTVGIGFTVTETVPGRLVHPLLSVIVTEYTPLALVVAFVIDGVLEFEVKPFGPVQVYVGDPATVAVLKEIVPVSHKDAGEAVAVGVVGSGLIVTDVFAVFVQPLASVTVSV